MIEQIELEERAERGQMTGMVKSFRWGRRTGHLIMIIKLMNSTMTVPSTLDRETALENY